MGKKSEQQSPYPAVRMARTLTFVACLVAAMVCGFGTVTYAMSSTLSHANASFGPSYVWTAGTGGSGSLAAAHGDTWVTGLSTRYDEDDDYHGTAESSWDSDWDGDIQGEGDGRWQIEMYYDGYVQAKAHYVETGEYPADEEYYSVATGTAEVYGDFSYFQERRRGVTHCEDCPDADGDYDATGGGNPPHSYRNGGNQRIVSDPHEGNACVSSASFGPAVSPFTSWHFEKDVDFHLFARGKQVLHCESEEDVSLSTKLTTSTDDTGGEIGWRGVLRAYEVLPNGQLKLIKEWPVPAP